jgi:hypothetical protein
VDVNQIDVMGVVYQEGMRAGIRTLVGAGVSGDGAASALIEIIDDAQGPGLIYEAGHAWLHEQGQAIEGEG